MVHVAFVSLVNLLTVYSEASAFCWTFAEGLLEVNRFLVDYFGCLTTHQNSVLIRICRIDLYRPNNYSLSHSYCLLSVCRVFVQYYVYIFWLPSVSSQYFNV